MGGADGAFTDGGGAFAGGGGGLAGADFAGGSLGGAALGGRGLPSTVFFSSTATIDSADFVGGLTSGRRAFAPGFDSGASGVRWLGGATGAAPLACGAGIARWVGFGFALNGPEGGAIAGFAVASFVVASFVVAVEDGPALTGGSFTDAGTASMAEADGELFGAAPSMRIAGIRDVESMRVEGTAPTSSASE